MLASLARRPGEALRDPEFKKLSVLIATAFIDMVGFAMVFPLLPFYALKLSATPEQIGMITAAFPIAKLTVAPFWGWVSDRRGRRPALLVGLFASAVAYVVFGFAMSVWMLFVSRLVQGAGGGTTGVVHAYISDSIEPGRRTRALGWLSAATNLGVMLGPIFGTLAVQFGPRTVGFVAAVLCLLNVAFTWKWLPESRHLSAASPVGKKKPAVWPSLLAVVATPGALVSRLTWIYGAGMLGFSGMTAVFALFLGAKFGVTERNIGWFFFYVGAISVVMRALLLGPVVRRIGEAGAMRAGTISLVIGLLLYPLVPTIWLLPLVMPLVPIGTALLFPATTALMSRASDQRSLGVTMGVAQTFAGIAQVAAPLIATAAFQRLGTAAPFLVAAGVVSLVGVLAFRLPATVGRPAETAPPAS